MSDTNPSILVVSSNNPKTRLLVELITQSSIVKKDGPHRLSQTWKINTKYYTANVDINLINEYYARNDDFNQAVKALIIHMDSDIELDLADLNKWDSIQNECDPEVKLLVWEYHDDQEKDIVNTVTEWSVKNGFEFIVLQPPNKTTVEDEDEIIKEKFGVDRIIEALQTYIWPNLEMKDISTNTHKSKQKHSGTSSNEEMNSNALSGDTLVEDDMEDFTELLGQLHMMKESIQTLSGVERKYCAEQVVTAFWKAIGGDDEEIGDL